MSKAIHFTDTCLLGILQKNDSEKIIQAYSADELRQLLKDIPNSILFYNQNQQAIEIRDQIEYADGQQHIEVFQDTTGVFGLRAYLQIGKVETPVTLELEDEKIATDNR